MLHGGTPLDVGKVLERQLAVAGRELDTLFSRAQDTAACASLVELLDDLSASEGAAELRCAEAASVGFPHAFSQQGAVPGLQRRCQPSVRAGPQGLAAEPQDVWGGLMSWQLQPSGHAWGRRRDVHLSARPQREGAVARPVSPDGRHCTQQPCGGWCPPSPCCSVLLRGMRSTARLQEEDVGASGGKRAPLPPRPPWTLTFKLPLSALRRMEVRWGGGLAAAQAALRREAHTWTLAGGPL